MLFQVDFRCPNTCKLYLQVYFFPFSSICMFEAFIICSILLILFIYHGVVYLLALMNNAVLKCKISVFNCSKEWVQSFSLCKILSDYGRERERERALWPSVIRLNIIQCYGALFNRFLTGFNELSSVQYKSVFFSGEHRVTSLYLIPCSQANIIAPFPQH